VSLLLEESERDHAGNTAADQEIQDAVHRFCSRSATMLGCTTR
jgi:hypothetical protein